MELGGTLSNSPGRVREVGRYYLHAVEVSCWIKRVTVDVEEQS